MALGKGTASKSSSGAAMSKYDVEVEARLQKLEAAVAELKEHSHEAPCDTSSPDTAALEQVKTEIFEARQSLGGYEELNAKIDDLTSRLSRKLSF